MLKKTLTAAAAILAAVSFAAPASASADDRTAADYLPIARAAFPESPCAGREVLNLVAPMDAPEEIGFQADGYAYGAAMQDGSCRIWIVPELKGYEACVTVVHEAGHLAGRDHEPTGIMAAGRSGLPQYGPCYAAQPKRRRHRANWQDPITPPRGSHALRGDR